MASALGLALAGVTALIPIGLRLSPPAPTMLGGLGLFGIVFALNSSVHSYLVLAYSEADRVSLSVGFYYMANAAGRLLGTLLSGVLYQIAGVTASLGGALASRGVCRAVSAAGSAGCGRSGGGRVARFAHPCSAKPSGERRTLG